MSNQETLRYVARAAQGLWGDARVETKKVDDEAVDEYTVLTNEGEVYTFQLPRRGNWTQESILEIMALIKSDAEA